VECIDTAAEISPSITISNAIDTTQLQDNVRNNAAQQHAASSQATAKIWGWRSTEVYAQNTNIPLINSAYCLGVGIIRDRYIIFNITCCHISLANYHCLRITGYSISRIVFPPPTTVHHDFDVVTLTFSNVARTPSAGEHRLQSSAMLIKSLDIPHTGCRKSSSHSDISTLLKSLLLAADLGNSPLKSTSSFGSNMSIRGPSGKVRGCRLASLLHHSMLSPDSIGLDAAAADVMFSGINSALVLETPPAAGRKYIGQHDTTVVVPCDASGGGVSTADRGRSKT